MEKMSKEEMKEIGEITRRVWPLQDLKVGEPLTQDQLDSIRFYLGSMIDAWPKCKVWRFEIKDGVVEQVTE